MSSAIDARPRPRLDRYYTLSELARSLMGITDPLELRRLRDRLLQLERAKGTSILVRSGGPQRPRYLVTMRALRRACPEIVEDADEREARARADRVAATIKGKLDELQEQIEYIASLCGNHGRRIAAIGTKLDTVARRAHGTRFGA